MAIVIQERARTLTDGIYSEWSTWVAAVTLPPYVSSDILEYKIESAMDTQFKTKYIENFKDILASTISPASPYAQTISFLDTEFNNYNITDQYKAQLKSQLLSNMTISFTNSSMQTAISITDKEIMSDCDYDNKLKQGALLDQQILKLAEDTLLVSAQEDAITQQVVDNRKIKVIDAMGECYGTVSAGGLTVSAEMWKVWFDFIKTLDNTSGVPSTTAITKVV